MRFTECFLCSLHCVGISPLITHFSSRIKQYKYCWIWMKEVCRKLASIAFSSKINSHDKHNKWNGSPFDCNARLRDSIGRFIVSTLSLEISINWIDVFSDIVFWNSQNYHLPAASLSALRWKNQRKFPLKLNLFWIQESDQTISPSPSFSLKKLDCWYCWFVFSTAEWPSRTQIR